MTSPNRQYAEALTEVMEDVGREHAASIGFDIATEAAGLFRMFMVVMTTPSLLTEAITRYEAKYPGWPIPPQFRTSSSAGSAAAGTSDPKGGEGSNPFPALQKAEEE